MSPARLAGLAGLAGLTAWLLLTATVSRSQEPPRTDLVTIEAMSPKQRALLGVVDGQPIPKRATLNLLRAAVINADLFEKYDHVGQFVVRSSRPAARQKELVILRVSWLYHSPYEWSQHYPKALELGLSPADINNIKIGSSHPSWRAQDKVILSAVDQLVIDGGLSKDQWENLQEYYSTSEVMTLITTVMHYHWAAMVSKSFHVGLNQELIGFD